MHRDSIAAAMFRQAIPAGTLDEMLVMTGIDLASRYSTTAAARSNPNRRREIAGGSVSTAPGQMFNGSKTRNGNRTRPGSRMISRAGPLVVETITAGRFTSTRPSFANGRRTTTIASNATMHRATNHRAVSEANAIRKRRATLKPPAEAEVVAVNATSAEAPVVVVVNATPVAEAVVATEAAVVVASAVAAEATAAAREFDFQSKQFLPSARVGDSQAYSGLLFLANQTQRAALT
jgi:hypothetical protein